MRPATIKKRIQTLAQRYLNAVRNAEGLAKALQELEQIEREMLPQMSSGETTPHKSAVRLQEALEVEGQLELAKIIAIAARYRQESRGGQFGGHYRSDYPAQDDNNWLKNIILKSEQGAISWRTVLPVKEE